MKRIDSFSITGMTLSGFKCYSEPTELTFGNLTVITGGNGRGKSSVADAIAFAITGLPFFGERGIDRIHSEQNPKLFVALRIVDGEGQPHELIRTRHRDRMTITFDGYEIRQQDLSEMFGERDVFLSIFNPLYFIEELGDNGKKLLERYLPVIPHDEVLPQLPESTRTSLEGEQIEAPEAYLKRLREDIREHEKTLVYLDGQKDLIEAQRRENKQKLTTISERLALLIAERDSLEEKRYTELDIAAMQEQLITLSARYEETAKNGSVQSEPSEIDEQIRELTRQLGERSAEQYVSEYSTLITEASAAIKTLGARYSRESTFLNEIRTGTVCPSCHRAITDNDLAAVRHEIGKSIDTIVSEGKTQRTRVSELRAADAAAEELFGKLRAEELERITNEIERLRIQRESSEAEQETDRMNMMETLRMQIQGLTSDIEFGNLTQAEYDRLSACREEILVLTSELNAVQQVLEDPSNGIAEKMAQTERLIVEKKKLLENVMAYIAKRAELTFSKLKMNRVEVSLFDVIKSTGEIRDTFKFTYNGRRYDRLSLSEKIRAGMELSELVKRLTERNYPVFVDNMESVDDLNNVRPTGQIIMAKCVRGTVLSVQSVNAMQFREAA